MRAKNNNTNNDRHKCTHIDKSKMKLYAKTQKNGIQIWIHTMRWNFYTIWSMVSLFPYLLLLGIGWQAQHFQIRISGKEKRFVVARRDMAKIQNSEWAAEIIECMLCICNKSGTYNNVVLQQRLLFSFFFSFYPCVPVSFYHCVCMCG